MRKRRSLLSGGRDELEAPQWTQQLVLSCCVPTFGGWVVSRACTAASAGGESLLGGERAPLRASNGSKSSKAGGNL